MPTSGKIEERVEIPDEVSVAIEGEMLVISSQNAKLERRLGHPRIQIAKEGSDVIVSCDFPRKKEIALIGTFVSHIRNMIVGATKGFQCRMRIVYSHFPMKASVKEEERIFLIENFLGERHPRTAKIVGETKIAIEGDAVRLTGHDKEHVGQSAANIEQATKIRGYDPRVFQDGIYIIEKPKVLEND
jgi:large subunit ribosomal protein L6